MSFMEVCVGIMTVSVVAIAVYLIQTLIQIKHTARAIEYAALNINDRVESTRGLFSMINDVTNTVRSFWFKAAQVGITLFSSVRGGR